MTELSVSDLSPKEVAEIEELRAKAALHRAEAADYELQHQLRMAEIARTEAETRQKAAEAAVAEIVRKERERVEQLAAIQDFYRFHYMFDSEVNKDSVNKALNTLAAWDRIDPECPMNITIDSPGGSVVSGMHLFDQLVSYSRRGGGNHLVTITVRGMAASMGGILVQAADRRLIGPESYMLIHEVSAGAFGKIGEIKDDVKWYEKVCDRIADIFVERSREAKGEEVITVEEFRNRWERKDWWLDSQEAYDLGFVDDIG